MIDADQLDYSRLYMPGMRRELYKRGDASFLDAMRLYRKDQLGLELKTSRTRRQPSQIGTRLQLLPNHTETCNCQFLWTKSLYLTKNEELQFNTSGIGCAAEARR